MAYIDTVQLALAASMVFLFASLGEVFDQRAGILNVGVEGMILTGALGSIVVAESTGNAWMGVGAGMFFGALLGVAHGVLSISLGVDQVVSGTAVWIFGLGATTYLGDPFTGPIDNNMPESIMGFSPLFYIGLVLVPVFWFVIFKTNFGLRLRTVGEDPSVAETAGIDVVKTRYLAVLVGGLMAGLSGAYLGLAYTPVWSQNMTLGRGFIAFAIVFFSFWNPILVLAGSVLFGSLWISSLTFQGVIPYLSTNLLKLLPYALTAVVLLVISGERFRTRMGAPAALGRPYSREE